MLKGIKQSDKELLPVIIEVKQWTTNWILGKIIT